MSGSAFLSNFGILNQKFFSRRLSAYGGDQGFCAKQAKASQIALEKLGVAAVQTVFMMVQKTLGRRFAAWVQKTFYTLSQPLSGSSLSSAPRFAGSASEERKNSRQYYPGAFVRQEASITRCDLFRPKFGQKMPQMITSHHLLEPLKQVLSASRDVFFWPNLRLEVAEGFHIR